jgi:hypothetical protein
MEPLLSRKFMVAVATMITIALNSEFGLDLDPEALVSLAVVAGAYIGGQAHVDKNKVAAQLDAEKALLSQRVVDLTNWLNSVKKEETT